ncbi:MAG TPA: hypothetical protein V6D19_00700 [Stenomitos sp.]
MADLSGSWLGTYWQRGKPTRFEMTLIQGGSTLCGNILDDRSLGEAVLDGQVIGRSVQFFKRYLDADLESVNYKGTLSEDGNSMRGSWDFYGVLGFESWEAHRVGDNVTLTQSTERLQAIEA